MKRIIPITIVAVNLVLILGWIGLEWLMTERRPAPVTGVPGATDSSPSSTRNGARPVRERLSVDSEAAPEETGDETAVPRNFDWRKPRDTASLRVTKPDPSPVGASSEERPRRIEPERASPRPASATPGLAGARSSSPASTEGTPPSTRPTQSRRPDDDTDTPAAEEPRDPSEDRVPPELEWLRFTPAEINSGAETTLSAAALDDLAGVRDMVGRLSSPSGNAHLGFALPRNEASGLWETIVRIPEKAESGRWSISWLRITDKANNTRDHRWPGGTGPPGSSLLVRSPDGDGEPPVLQSVTLDRTTMGAGESVQVEVMVSDDPSGVRFVSGTFQSPSGKAWAPFTATGEGSRWTGAVTVPDDGECGEWTLRRVTAIDNANNQATWGAGDERIAGIRFYRSFSGSCDADPPELTRIELSPRTVANEVDSRIEITAFIDDVGSGVANASGFAMVSDPARGSPQRVHFTLQRSGEGVGTPWVGTIQIPRHSMAGRWDIRALRVADEARNQRTYGPADPVMANAWFVVE